MVNPIQAQKYLKGADYPMTKEQVVDLARSNDAPSDVVEALEAVSKESFDGPNAVVKAMSDAGTAGGAKQD